MKQMAVVEIRRLHVLTLQPGILSAMGMFQQLSANTAIRRNVVATFHTSLRCELATQGQRSSLMVVDHLVRDRDCRVWGQI
jgi:hypothetical protein